MHAYIAGVPILLPFHSSHSYHSRQRTSSLKQCQLRIPHHITHSHQLIITFINAKLSALLYGPQSTRGVVVKTRTESYIDRQTFAQIENSNYLHYLFLYDFAIVYIFYYEHQPERFVACYFLFQLCGAVRWIRLKDGGVLSGNYLNTLAIKTDKLVIVCFCKG